jgi:hypothetical protein
MATHPTTWISLPRGRFHGKHSLILQDDTVGRAASNALCGVCDVELPRHALLLHDARFRDPGAGL